MDLIFLVLAFVGAIVAAWATIRFIATSFDVVVQGVRVRREMQRMTALESAIELVEEYGYAVTLLEAEDTNLSWLPEQRAVPAVEKETEDSYW